MSSFLPVNWLSSVWQTLVIWLWVAAAFGGAVVVGASLLSSIFSYKISSATERQAKVERDENMRLTSEADARARNGEARAAIANAEAARANERAAALELQIEQERTERLRLNVAVERISPRILLPAQAEVIRAELQQNQHPKLRIGISHDAACADCSAYASQIADLLNSAGFTVEVGMLIGVSVQSKFGLVFDVHMPSAAMQTVEEIAKSFTGAGLPVDFITSPQPRRPPGWPGRPEADFRIMVLPISAPR